MAASARLAVGRPAPRPHNAAPGARVEWRAVAAPYGTGEAALQRNVSRALGLLARHEVVRRVAAARAQALADLGDIDLPDLDTPAPAAYNPALLAPLGPLYLAHELEQAGVLRTAESVAGLFASGAIQQPLGAIAGRINDFWHQRNQRLTEAERAQLLGQLFEPQVFNPRMQRLCAAIAALADNADASDLREEVGLEQAGLDLVDMLAARSGGMLAYAASDILAAVKVALGFLGDRGLQLAFGAQDLWSLVSSAGAAQGVDASEVRRHVDLARDGANVLVWLAGAAGRGSAGGAGGTLRLDPARPEAAKVIAAALRWQMAWRDADSFAGLDSSRTGPSRFAAPA